MDKQLIRPPESPALLEGPVIFLAGPIQGATDWQDDAIKILKAADKPLAIASPRRDNLSWEFDFNGQVDWETRFLDVASHQGVILFWLAKEAEHVCERAYAQTTRLELGEWLYGVKKCKGDQVRIALGIEDGFTGGRYIRRRLDTHPELKRLPVFKTLKETCDEAIKLCPKWAPITGLVDNG